MYGKDFKVPAMKISTILGILLILCTAAILIAQKVPENEDEESFSGFGHEKHSSGKEENTSDAPGSLGKYFVLVNCKSCKIDSELVVKGSEKNKTSEDAGSSPMGLPYQEETDGDDENFYEDYDTDSEHGNDYGDEDYPPNGRPQKPEKNPCSERKKPKSKPIKSPCQKKTDEGDDDSDKDFHNQYYGNENEFKHKDFSPKGPKKIPEHIDHDHKNHPSSPDPKKKKPGKKPMGLPCQKKNEKGDEYLDDDSYDQDYIYRNDYEDKDYPPKGPPKPKMPPFNSKPMHNQGPKKGGCGDKDYPPKGGKSPQKPKPVPAIPPEEGPSFGDSEAFADEYVNPYI